jgi:hypothetical protein
VLAQLVTLLRQRLQTVAILYFQVLHLLAVVVVVSPQRAELPLVQAVQAAVHLLTLQENKVQETHLQLAHLKAITAATALTQILTQAVVAAAHQQLVATVQIQTQE